MLPTLLLLLFLLLAPEPKVPPLPLPSYAMMLVPYVFSVFLALLLGPGLSLPQPAASHCTNSSSTHNGFTPNSKAATHTRPLLGSRHDSSWDSEGGCAWQGRHWQLRPMSPSC